MLTLSYGFKKPQTGDKGSTFFPALEGNFQQLNDHTHNGSDSAKLTSASSVVVTQSIASGSWVSYGSNGLYRQMVTLPVSIAQVSDVRPSFRDSTGDYYSLRTETVSTTTFYVYANDNSLNLTVVYTS